MPTYIIPGGRSNRPDPNYYHHDYGQQKQKRDSNEYGQIYSPVARAPRRRWPPPPSVEDEKISLSREHSPEVPGLDGDEVSMRGSVDQMPILYEIGKEDELEEPDLRRNKQGRMERPRHMRRSSSSDSFGPDTPTDSSASESVGSRRRRKEQQWTKTSRGPSIKDILNDQRRPENLQQQTPPQLPERPVPGSRPSAPYSLHRPGGSREIYEIPSNQQPYPATLEELKPHPRESERMGFAHRNRTMSGSSSAADHRPANTRHMSAMGYPGEGQTKSFPRDHRMMYASPLSATSNSVPPAWQRPRERLQTAIDSSDSDISPDEIFNRKTRQRTSSRTHHPLIHQQGPVQTPREDSQRTHSSRPSSPEPRMAKQKLVAPGIQQQRGATPVRPTSRHSPTTSSWNSGYSSPPGPTEGTSRPGSRDGAAILPYPALKKLPQQMPLTGSSVGSYSHPEHHASSNLRYSSRPSSPIREATKPRHDLLQPELPNEHRNPNVDRIRSRDSSPISLPRSPRISQSGLKVTTQPELLRMHSMPGPEMKQRPPSIDGPAHVFIPSPTIQKSATTWPADKTQSQPQPVQHASAPTVYQSRPAPARGLMACPRPGFSTRFNDWWTVAAVPELDLCPDCKDSLQDNGFEGKFLRSPPRAAGTKTRCDMNIPWIRIAWLLILARREKVDVLMDLAEIQSSEQECPGREGGIRKKWYRVYDADSDKNISDFNVCANCVRSIRAVFPNLEDTFTSQITTSNNSLRVCDLTASTPRFGKYIDVLDQISAESRQFREEPDTRSFIRLVKDFAGIRPCQRDNQFRAVPWHYIHHLPDFTICEECFMDVVKPAQRAGSEIAEQVNRKTAMPYDMDLKLSCQLYSARMRLIFEECCRNQDFSGLREHAMARISKERELQQRVELVRSFPEEWQDKEMARLIDEWKRWE